MCNVWMTYYFVCLVIISVFQGNVAESKNNFGIFDEYLDKAGTNEDTLRVNRPSDASIDDRDKGWDVSSGLTDNQEDGDYLRAKINNDEVLQTDNADVDASDDGSFNSEIDNFNIFDNDNSIPELIHKTKHEDDSESKDYNIVYLPEKIDHEQEIELAQDFDGSIGDSVVKSSSLDKNLPINKGNIAIQDVIKHVNEIRNEIRNKIRNATEWIFRGHVPSIFTREQRFDEPPLSAAPRSEVVVDTRKGYNTDEVNLYRKNYALLYAQTLERE